MSMSEQVATQYAEKLLSAFSTQLPPRRVSNYARRLARFDEDTAEQVVEKLCETCKTCPSIAEMLDALYARQPHTGIRLGGAPAGFPQCSGVAPAPRRPKTKDSIEASRTQAEAWMRTMLAQFPGCQCDLCQEEIGTVANLSKFIERCAQARYGDEIDAALRCDGCER